VLLNLLGFEQTMTHFARSKHFERFLRTMNNVLLCMILFVQLWNFREGLLDLALRRHTETGLRSELKALQQAVSAVRDDLKTLQQCAVPRAHAHK
jgi:cell division protein FtsB